MKRHPSDRLLVAYGEGELPFLAGLVVAAHVETCVACRARILDIEESGGRMLTSLPPAEMAGDALKRALARIASDEEPASEGRVQRRLGDIELPEALWSLRMSSRQWLMRGMWVAHVKCEPTDRWRAFILRAPEGGYLPRHGHSGEELVALLHGSYSDGTTYVAGDFVENDSTTEHDLRVVGSGPCAALIATEGPIRWRGPAKLLGFLLGI